MNKPIRLHGVRQNNLKNISVEIPHRKLTVITGLSGSGKSSLAFDTLYAEGQRRYVESLSTYTRQFLEKMPKPELERIENIPPAIALEQRNHVIGSRSTVGSQTEVIDYLRLLFAKTGITECVDCGSEVKRMDTEDWVETVHEFLKGDKGFIAAPYVRKEKKKIKVENLLAVLRERGFRRILRVKSKKKFEVIDLDDFVEQPSPLPLSAFDDGEVHIVMDRLAIPDGPANQELKTRLFDSITQATRFSSGKITIARASDSKWVMRDSQFSCGKCGKLHRIPEPPLFSWSSPLGACSTCSGFGFTLDLDEGKVIPDPSKTLKNGAIDPLSKPSMEEWQSDLFRFAERHGISIGKRYRELTATQRNLLWDGDPKDKVFEGIRGCFEYLAKKKYKLHVRVFIRRYQSQTLCRSCKGARLSVESLAVKVGGKTIHDLCQMPVEESLPWFESLKLKGSSAKIAEQILGQIRKRLFFLNEVGVGYLSLSRLAKSLSGGEFQRINLATQLGNGLCGTLYVLDEPSIGLHASDTERLIRVLSRLRDQGNTVVVVEHDLDVIQSADWVLELGPGAGKRGGQLLHSGTIKDLIGKEGSPTGSHLERLASAATLPFSPPTRPAAKKFLKITGCTENNLKNLTVKFPLERFVVVTGLSGSGKSTLVHKTLFHGLNRIFSETPGILPEEAGKFDQLYGAEQILGVHLLDQKPIGKSSRSNPATYLKAWDEFRRLFANQVSAIRRGLAPQHFSFNVDGGRCPACKGEGEVTFEMHFMADIRLPCEECRGKRFKKNILDIVCRGKNIYQLLCTTIDEAYDIFRDNPILARKLGILRDVGLGYLQLGQSAPTLSGGESQRLKIAGVLDSADSHHQLYIFDEPTTGLHQEDIRKLLMTMQDLVQARNSIIMIEHHLDVIAASDWVIDLGPGGGKRGGAIIAQGTPAQLVAEEASITGQMLLRNGVKPPQRSEDLSPPLM